MGQIHPKASKLSSQTYKKGQREEPIKQPSKKSTAVYIIIATLPAVII